MFTVLDKNLVYQQVTQKGELPTEVVTAFTTLAQIDSSDQSRLDVSQLHELKNFVLSIMAMLEEASSDVTTKWKALCDQMIGQARSELNMPKQVAYVYIQNPSAALRDIDNKLSSMEPAA